MPVRTCAQKLLGTNMCIASPAVIGLGIADVILTYQVFCPGGTCIPLNTALALSWVGVGIWAPLVTFFNGLFAVKMAGRCPEKSFLCLLSFFATFIFTPILIIIPALEVSYKFPTGPPPDSSTGRALFGIEVTIAVAGAVLFLHAFGILWLSCCCRECMHKHMVKGADQPQPLPQDLQGPSQLNALQSGVLLQQPYVYRLGNSPSGPGGNRYYGNYSNGNYQVPKEVLAGARW